MQYGGLQGEHSFFQKQLDDITGQKKNLETEVHSLKSQIKALNSEVEEGQATLRDTKVLFDLKI